MTPLPPVAKYSANSGQRPCPLPGRKRPILTLLNDPDSYLEASATAGFAAGIFKAVRLGYLDDAFLPVAGKACRGIIEHISPQGELTQVSFGTAMGNDLDHYRNIPLTAMPYYQAMAILCLVEALRRTL